MESTREVIDALKTGKCGVRIQRRAAVVIERLVRESAVLEQDIRRLTWLILHGREKYGALWTEMTDEEIDEHMKNWSV